MPIEIPLTQGHVAVVDDEDAHLARFKWHALRSRHTTYAVRKVYGDGRQTTLYLHRVVMGAPRGFEVDHRDRNGLNCRRSNLRLATASQNRRNAERYSGNRSGFKGVRWHRHRRKWEAEITVNSQGKSLGYFDSAEEAARAYDVAARAASGEFAHLNFSEPTTCPEPP